MDVIMDLAALSLYAQGLCAIGTLIASTIIAVLVYTHTRRKDRLDLILRRWTIQQDINLLNISSTENLETAERLVYGAESVISIDKARMYYHVFLRLNLLQMMFFGNKEGLISKDELRSSSINTARLLCNNKEMVKYSLNERGYGPDFANHVLGLLDSLEPPQPMP
jgi:hypothetical protein